MNEKMGRGKEYSEERLPTNEETGVAVDRLYPRTWSHNLTRGVLLVYTADGTGA